jgi:tetrahydromethanopterin S-methyltransferase subunit C
MSTPDKQVPPVGEEIHLPGPSLQPVLLTVGITLALVGVTTSIYLVVAGAILSVCVIIRWIADTRREIASFPAESEHH